MKTKILIFLALLTLPVMGFRTKPEAEVTNDGYYAFIVVDGTWKNGTGYASNIIHFPGYSSCNQIESTYFFQNAKRAFSDYLKAYYNSAFPYGENNNFQEINMPRHSTSEYLGSYQQAQQRLTEWVADQRAQGYSVQHTNFGYNCSNY